MSFQKFSQVFTSFHKFSQVFTSFHKFSQVSPVFSPFQIFSNESTRLMAMALLDMYCVQGSGTKETMFHNLYNAWVIGTSVCPSAQLSVQESWPEGLGQEANNSNDDNEDNNNSPIQSTRNPKRHLKLNYFLNPEKSQR